jgi:hypothetical protein
VPLASIFGPLSCFPALSVEDPTPFAELVVLSSSRVAGHELLVVQSPERTYLPFPEWLANAKT